MLKRRSLRPMSAKCARKICFRRLCIVLCRTYFARFQAGISNRSYGYAGHTPCARGPASCVRALAFYAGRWVEHRFLCGPSLFMRDDGWSIAFYAGPCARFFILYRGMAAAGAFVNCACAVCKARVLSGCALLCYTIGVRRGRFPEGGSE